MSTDTTRRDRDNGRGLATILGSIAASVVLLAVLLPLAQRHRETAIETARRAHAEEQRMACIERGSLFVPRISDPLPMTDPSSDLWSQAPGLNVPLQKQTVAMPMMTEITVASVKLQGLTDGEHIVWRVSWQDEQADANVDAGRFTDAVALQFAITPNATFSMGDRGKLVQILHWKALWQKDVDEHFQDVQDLHPNYWADLYWFAEGRPYKIPESFTDPRSHQWFAAYSAGNPVADIYRALPVEELAAEGYGTLTSQSEALTVGRGTWQNKEWSVVFARPLRSRDTLDYQFHKGSRGNLGVAVWNGGAGNVGGRKHWSNWIEFEVSL